VAASLLAALGAEPAGAPPDSTLRCGDEAPAGPGGEAVGAALRLGDEAAAEPGGEAAGAALRLGEQTVAAAPSTPAEDWAASGVAELTGRPEGPPLMPVGAPATLARGLGLAIAALGGPPLDGAELLGWRVGAIPLERGGARSAGGAARLLATADGWVALSLPRPADAELVPALIDAGVGREELDSALVGAEPEGDDPWPALAAWAGGQTAAAVVEQAALLGLAVAALGERSTAGPAWELRRLPADPLAAPTRVVVNLGALWAAPLCAQLLRRAGWSVVDVEAAGRPDPSPPALRALLRAGHETVRLDLSEPAGRERLAELLAGADAVIEASRPRALRQLGLDADRVMADRRPRTWIRITGHGPESERIAFGDDAAVAGGLVTRDADGPAFAGDALADPLSGMTAAMLALACTRAGGAWIADVPMAGVAAMGAAT